MVTTLSVDVLVRYEGEKLRWFRRRGHLLEQLPRKTPRRGLCRDGVAYERHRHDAPVRQACAVAQPLPDLRAADLSGRRILHQIMDRHTPVAGEPCREVRHPHLD